MIIIPYWSRNYDYRSGRWTVFFSEAGENHMEGGAEFFRGEVRNACGQPGLHALIIMKIFDQLFSAREGSTPRGSTAVENTSRVLVTPNFFCRIPIKVSSSMVFLNATLISIE